jgi:hypothetical protein
MTVCSQRKRDHNKLLASHPYLHFPAECEAYQLQMKSANAGSTAFRRTSKARPTELQIQRWLKDVRWIDWLDSHLLFALLFLSLTNSPST